MNATLIRGALARHKLVLEKLEADISGIEEGSNLVSSVLGTGGKLILFGNGGSAASAQHFAAELTGRYQREREPLPGLALTTDSSALTAIGNDYGFSFLFARQVQALANASDLCIGLTTSGRSANVITALEAGAVRGCRLIALTGDSGLATDVSGCLVVRVPATETARIQEMHDLILHIWCEALDAVH